MSVATTMPAELENSLGFNLDRTAVLFRRELLRVLAEAGLQPEQWQALIVLRSAGAAMSQQNIADRLLADKHAVSRMLSRMERDGWVQRVRGQDDSRSQQVALTMQAHKRVPMLLRQVRAHFRKQLLPIEGFEREELLRLLTKLRHLLEDTT